MMNYRGLYILSVVFWLSLSFVSAANAVDVSLAWDYTQNPARPATGFVVERCTGNNCTNFVALTTPPVPASQLAYTDTTAANSTTYQWRVRAIDAQGGTSAPSNVVIFLTPEPSFPAPTNLRRVVTP